MINYKAVQIDTQKPPAGKSDNQQTEKLFAHSHLEEIWVDILNYESVYQVSNLGNVRSLTRKVYNGKGYYTLPGKNLKPNPDPSGYLQVSLSKSNRKKMFMVSRLVIQHFLNVSIEGKQIDHVDHDITNNCLQNLRLCSPRQNSYNTRSRRDSSSKYKGVSKYKNKWRAQIEVDCNGYTKNKHLGVFRTELEAKKAYDTAAKLLHGEFFCNEL